MLIIFFSEIKYILWFSRFTIEISEANNLKTRQTMKTILTKISGLRIKRGLGRGKMANIIGVNTSTYTKMEKGVYLISLPRLYQIADALNVKCEALLDNENPELDYLEEQYIKSLDSLRHYNQLIITEQGKLIALHEKLK